MELQNLLKKKNKAYKKVNNAQFYLKGILDI